MEKVGSMLFYFPLLSVIPPMILHGLDFIMKILRKELLTLIMYRYVCLHIHVSEIMPCAH